MGYFRKLRQNGYDVTSYDAYGVVTVENRYLGEAERRLLVTVHEFDKDGNWDHERTDLSCDYMFSPVSFRHLLPQEYVDLLRRMISEYMARYGHKQKRLAIIGASHVRGFGLMGNVKQQLVLEARDIFIKACEGIFKPKLIFDEFAIRAI